MIEATATKKVVKKAPAKAPKMAPVAKTGAFAVIATGGKQYLVRPGQTLKIEKMVGEYKEGGTITFNEVLMSGDAIGTPFVVGGSVSATLKKIGRYKTIDVIKYKQKSRYFKKNGHRQPYFEVLIEGIK